MDNCSNDKTELICARYLELYPDIIRYVRQEENIGLDRNIDSLILHSRGEFVKLLGDDDLLHLDFLSRINNLLSDSSVDIILHKYKELDDHLLSDPADEVQRYFADSRIFQDSNGIVGQIASITFNRESYLGLANDAVNGTNHKFMFVAIQMMMKSSAIFQKAITLSVRPGSPRFTSKATDSLQMQRNAILALVYTKNLGQPWNKMQSRQLDVMIRSQRKYCLTFLDFVHRYSEFNSIEVISQAIPMVGTLPAFYFKAVPKLMIPKKVGNFIAKKRRHGQKF
jgi:hypothetical protein